MLSVKSGNRVYRKLSDYSYGENIILVLFESVNKEQTKEIKRTKTKSKNESI